MFGVTATSAVLALWVVQSRRYTTTPFIQSFDALQVVRTIGTNRGFDVRVLSTNGGRSQTMVPATRAMRYRLESAPATQSLIVNDMKAAILEQLIKLGANIQSNGNSTGVAIGGPEFVIEYSLGEAQGFVGVYSLTDGTESWKLLILVHEFPRSSSSFAGK